jgi:hypothetical protein
MRVVTLITIAFDHNLVGAACVLWQHLFVAFGAKLCGVRGQQIFLGRRMRNMASGTFPFFQKWMHITTLESFLKGLMTFQTYFPFGAGFKLEFTLRISRCDHNKGKYNAE